MAKIEETLKNLPSEEFKRLLKNVVKDRGKAKVLSKIVGEMIAKETKELKEQTELAILQSNYYILERDLEEVAFLPEVIEKYKDINGEFWERFKKEQNLTDEEAKMVYSIFRNIVSPFPASEGVAWVVKTLKNHTVDIVKKTSDKKVKMEKIPIVVIQNPSEEIDLGEDKKLVLKTYTIGIPYKTQPKKSKGKRKRVEALPLFTLSLQEWIEKGEVIESKVELTSFAKGLELTAMNLEDLNKAYKNPITVEMEAGGYTKEEIAKLSGEIFQKIIDKYAFFVYATPSSKLNKSLREYLLTNGFITMRKNQSVFIAKDEEKENFLFLKLKEARIVGYLLKQVYRETIERVRGSDIALPSIKGMPASRYILLEEVALLSKEEIEKSLIEKFHDYILKLQTAYQEDTNYTSVKATVWYREALTLIERLENRLPEELRLRWQRIERELQQREMERNFVRILNSFHNNPTLEGIDKILSHYDDELFKSYRNVVKKDLEETLLNELDKGVKIAPQLILLLENHKDKLDKLLKDNPRLLSKIIIAIKPVSPKKAKELQERWGIEPEESIKKTLRRFIR